MNKDHVVGGLGGAGLTAAIAAALAYHLSIPEGAASSDAFIIVTALGAIAGWLAWVIKWRWPDAPALPDFEETRLHSESLDVVSAPPKREGQDTYIPPNRL